MIKRTAIGLIVLLIGSLFQLPAVFAEPNMKEGMWEIKGEMKLVGLRPLSKARFNEFPEDLKIERIKYKPGCIAPYVALKMPDDKENIKAERIYIKDLSEHHYLTDFRYFMKAVYNILTFKIKSS